MKWNQVEIGVMKFSDVEIINKVWCLVDLWTKQGVYHILFIVGNFTKTISCHSTIAYGLVYMYF